MTTTSVAIDLDAINASADFTIESSDDPTFEKLPELPRQKWTLRLFVRWCWANLRARLKGGKLHASDPTDPLWMESMPIKAKRRTLDVRWSLETHADLKAFSGEEITLEDAVKELVALCDYERDFLERAKLNQIVIEVTPPAPIVAYEEACQTFAFNLHMSGRSQITRQPCIDECLPKVRAAWANLTPEQRRDARVRFKAGIWRWKHRRRIRRLRQQRQFTLHHEIAFNPTGPFAFDMPAGYVPLGHYEPKMVPMPTHAILSRCDA